MSRYDTIAKVEAAIDNIRQVQEDMQRMGATHTWDNRLDTLLRRLEDLRADVFLADLPLASE